MLALIFNRATPSDTPPVADFVGFPLSGDIPLAVQFTDMSTGTPPTAWAWLATGQVFGESYTSNLQNPLITFLEPDTYDVELTVSNVFGFSSVTKFSYVVVGLPTGLGRVPDWSAEPGVDSWSTVGTEGGWVAEPGVTAWSMQ